MENGININLNMLTWAINRAGQDVDEFISRFPKVKEWLEEDKKPTFNQLQTFSQKVHVPLGYLFLQSPPDEQLPIPFFRTTGKQKKKVSINVLDTITLLKNRQEWLRDYLQENDYSRIKFAGKFHHTHKVPPHDK